MAAPFLLSPLVGWLVDAVGFERVFFAAAGLVLVAGALTFTLAEPRHHVRFGEPAVVEPGADE